MRSLLFTLLLIPGAAFAQCDADGAEGCDEDGREVQTDRDPRPDEDGWHDPLPPEPDPPEPTCEENGRTGC